MVGILWIVGMIGMVEMRGVLGVVGIVVMNQIEQAEVQREPNIVSKGCYCTHRGAPKVAAILFQPFCAKCSRTNTETEHQRNANS